MTRPTRFYSSRQEKAIAKAVGGKQVANSGATTFNKGDVKTEDWLLKNKEEAFAMGKPYSALVFDFGDGHNYYVLDEKTFLKMKEAFENG